jgi:predicted small metal-binding protein
MARKYIDCREHRSAGSKCTVAISADSDNELVEAAVHHGISAHGMQDSPELRKEIKSMIKEGSPSS